MAKLIKNIGSEVVLAETNVYAPTYTLTVNEIDANTILPDGWMYTVEDITSDDFPSGWTQPSGAHDAYPAGVEVMHGGLVWISIIDANVWEPGIFGWIDQSTSPSIAIWQQPGGAHNAYPLGSKVSHNGEGWISDVEANVWEPGVFGWRTKVSVPEYVSTIPSWVQPLGSEDAYSLGAVVQHNGLTWVSTVAANVWEPGVFGWEIQA